MYERNYHQRVLKKDTSNEVPPKKKWKRWLVVLLILSILYGVVALVRHPRFQIATIAVEGTEVVDPEDLVQFAQEKFQGSHLWIFPKTSTFLLQTDTLAQSIKATYPRISEISVSRDGIQGVSISIIEHKGAYLWCTDETCFFMDSVGIVYSKAPVFSGSAYQRIYTGTTAGVLPFQGVTPETLVFLKTLGEGMVKGGVAPEVFRFISEKELRVDFSHNKNTAQFIVDPTTPAEVSVEYLYSGIRTPPLSTSFGDAKKRLRYIDVRYPNNIVYKFDEIVAENVE